MEHVLIKIKIGESVKLVKFPEEACCDLLKFLEIALSAFHIEAKDDLDVELFDLNVPKVALGVDTFALAVLQFHKCSQFGVEIRINNMEISTNVAALKNCIELNQCDYIFKEEKRLNALLPKTRKRLVNVIYSYIQEKVSRTPTTEQLIDVCRAVTELFPSLHTENSQIGGIDKLYNHVKRCGFLYDIIKNRNKKNKLRLPPQHEPSEEEIAEMVELFRTCVVSRDYAEIVNKLKQTADYRKNQLREKDQFANIPDFYFADPTLITIDFDIMFPQAVGNALLTQWPAIELQPYRQFNIRIDENMFPFEDEQMMNFLMWFQLFLPRRAKKDTAMNSFMIYSSNPTDDPMKLLNNKNKHPHIIMISSASSPKDRKYYIDMKKHILSVPANYEFMDVVDLFLSYTRHSI